MKIRNSKKMLLMLFSLFFALSMILTACSTGSSSENKTNNNDSTQTNNDNNNKDSEKLAEKQELHLTKSSDIRSLDSAKPSDLTSVSMLSRIQSGLLTYNEDMNLIPELAKNMPETNADKTVYTFELRDAKWSDGSPIKAKQFVYAWRRAIDPDTKSLFDNFFASAHIKNAADIMDKDSHMYGKTKKLGVEAPDNHTLKVTLSKSTPERYFNSFMQHPIFFPLKKAFVEKHKSNYAQEPDNLLYSGPFKLKKWDHGEGWTFEKNDTYWNADKVSLNKVTYKIVKSKNTALKLYNSGKIDYTTLTSEDVDKYRNNDEFATHPTASTYYWVLNYNKVPEFENTKLRRAIWLSMDRKSGAEVILNDGSLPQNYLVPQAFATGPNGNDFHAKNTSADLTNYPDHDKNTAKKLWKEAKNELGINQLNIELLTTDTEKSKDLAEYYVNQVTSNLKGLNMTIQRVPFKTYLDKQANGNCDICGGSGWAPDYEDPTSFLELFKTGNPSYSEFGFSDKTYDQMMEKASKMGDQPEKRWKVLQKADKYLADNAVYIPTYQKGIAVLTKSYVKDFFVRDGAIGANTFYRYAKILNN